MFVPRNPRKKLATLAALGVMLVAAPAAHANPVSPNLGLKITAVDAATRTITGIQHCTSSDRDGRSASFPVSPDIEFNQFRPGMSTGVAVDANGVIVSGGDMPCDWERQSGGDADGGKPSFSHSFLNRVWKFSVVIDGGGAKLHVTIRKVLNLPQSMKTQDDALVGQPGLVVLSGGIHIFKDGKPLPPGGSLDDLDGKAVIQGKLLPPSKWAKDEMGDVVPTMVARKIYV
jgi:hypothetical protein